MDIIAWREFVPTTLTNVVRTSPRERATGMHYRQLAQHLASQPRAQRHDDEVSDALVELRNLGLVEDHGSSHYWKVTAIGRELASDMTPLWQNICQARFDAEHEDLLVTVNQLSTYNAEDHAGVNWMSRDEVLTKLAWPDEDLLYPVARELEQ